MTLKRRLLNIIASLVTIFTAILMMIAPTQGINIIITTLSVSVLIYSIQTLIYYFTMAKYMVNGRMILWKGLVALCIGMYLYALNNLPYFYVTIYLLITLFFAGAVDIMRAVESKRLNHSFPKFKLFSGIVNVTAAILCVVFSRHVTIAVDIYGMGLIISSFIRIAEAFRRTAIIYIR